MGMGSTRAELDSSRSMYVGVIYLTSHIVRPVGDFSNRSLSTDGIARSG